MVRSAAAMSGRRSNSADGTPGGTTGTSLVSSAAGIVRSAGGLPASTAIACSDCARDTPAATSSATVDCNCTSAASTSERAAVPASYWFCVIASACR